MRTPANTPVKILVKILAKFLMNTQGNDPAKNHTKNPMKNSENDRVINSQINSRVSFNRDRTNGRISSDPAGEMIDSTGRRVPFLRIGARDLTATMAISMVATNMVATVAVMAANMAAADTETEAMAEDTAAAVARMSAGTEMERRAETDRFPTGRRALVLAAAPEAKNFPRRNFLQSRPTRNNAQKRTIAWLHKRVKCAMARVTVVAYKPHVI